MYQYELAGIVSEQYYEQCIPKECSMQSIQEHYNMMLCYGLMNAIETGGRMNCSGCDENKVNVEARMKRIASRTLWAPVVINNITTG